MSERILIIRLGALGDVLIAMKAYQDIRNTYPNAHITFLTAPAFAGLARQMPWFDVVMEDARAPFWNIPAQLALYQKLKAGNFTLVFDLQNKPRTAFYFYLFFGGRVKWSGHVKGCTFPRPVFTQKIHRREEYVGQIRAAGVADSGPLHMDWLKGDISVLNLPEDFTVFIPGCSPHRPEKRWPATHFIKLAVALKEKGLKTVVIGTKADEEAVNAICKEVPEAINLQGRTTFGQLASLCRLAKVVVGNDTGPTHLAALAGAPTLSLFCGEVDPVQAGPLGPHASFLQEDDIAAITPEAVCEKLKELGAI